VGLLHSKRKEVNPCLGDAAACKNPGNRKNIRLLGHKDYSRGFKNRGHAKATWAGEAMIREIVKKKKRNGIEAGNWLVTLGAPNSVSPQALPLKKIGRTEYKPAGDAGYWFKPGA